MLALLDTSCEEDKEPLVVCGLCLRRRCVEPAGKAFHYAHERPLLEGKRKGGGGGGGSRRGGGGDASGDDEPEEKGDASWRKKRKEGGGGQQGSLKLSPHLKGVDLYALLEVPENASTEQIKKQYRAMALKHHPDKQGGAADGADAGKGKEKTDKTDSGLSKKELLFVQIQEAYEALSDPSKRRQYDSSLPFDDSTPKEVDEKLGFYGTFGPVFQRNSRWSNRSPVPDLGDEKTDIAKVHKFYDFWCNFETWRDFSMHDEYNLDDADCREERRWMERQNQRGRKEYDSEERKRIFRLAETAERLDPRIKAEREEKEAKKREEKERRARIKQEEEEAKQRVEEERRKEEERKQAEKEEKERLEREERKQNKEVTKKLRQRLKKYVQGQCSLSVLEMEELQELCLSLEAEALKVLCTRLEALPASKAKAEAAVRAELKEFKVRKAQELEEQEKQRQEAKLRDEQKASAAKEAVAATSAPWSTEELGLLAKGLQKFPGGMGGRWNLITQQLNLAGYARTEKEVVDKTKELSDGQSLRSMGSRLHKEDTFVPPKAASAAKAVPAAKAMPATAAAPAKAAPPAKAAAGGYPAPGVASAPDVAAKASSPAKAAAGAAAPVAAASADEWSAVQQKALENALLKHPATLDKNERWRLIAEDVPGKTKAQCVERFKWIREQLKKK